MEYYEIKQKKKKGKKAKKVKATAKAQAKPKPKPLPRSVMALLQYLGKSETPISQGRVPQRIQPTEQSITINLAGLERVSAPPAQDVLRSFIAGTKERAGQNIQVAFQQQTYDQVSQLKKQLEDAEREQKRYESRLKQGEDVLGALQQTTQTKGVTERRLQQSEAQLRVELDNVRRQVTASQREGSEYSMNASTQYRQVRENIGRFYKSQGLGFAGGGGRGILGDAEVFDDEVPTGAGRAGSIDERARNDFYGVLSDIQGIGKAQVAVGSPTATYSSLSRPDSYVAPSFSGSLERSLGSSAKSTPAPAPRKKKIKLVAKKGSTLEALMSEQIKTQGRVVGMAVAGGGEADVGVASPLETATSKQLRSRLAEIAGTKTSKVRLAIKGRGAGAKYATITTDIEQLKSSGLAGADLIQAIKQRHGANIQFV